MAADVIKLICQCEFNEGKIVIDDLRRVAGRLPRSRFLKVLA